jgi:hypothetical protein
MDQFSFHGPFAYRWIDDVPVERIDLRSGERRPIEVGKGGLPPVLPGEEPSDALPCSRADVPRSRTDAVTESASETIVRAAMAAWN